MDLIKMNEPLPDWTLDSIFGDEVPKREAYLGQPLLILFFSLGCPGCLGRAIPFANRMVVERGRELRVMGIHTNFTGSDFGRAYFQKAKEEFYIRFPFYKDYNFDTTFLDYSGVGTPHWVLVDKDGRAIYSLFGSEPNNGLLRLDLRIRELLDN